MKKEKGFFESVLAAKQDSIAISLAELILSRHEARYRYEKIFEKTTTKTSS
ncbi:MAG: hypothetical protein JW860_16310 [Sedimentisphaerales bacterium]|nr:hypothetical protein [Sedimentisphaerales bacterium]